MSSSLRRAMASTCFASATTPGGSRVSPGASRRAASTRGRARVDPPSPRASRRRGDVTAGASNDENAVRRGVKNVLGFFKERVDMALEDKDEAAISRIVDDGVWAIDLSVFVREPVGPLDAKAAAKLDRTSLTLECAFGDRDEGAYPSRGGAEARRSRFFGEPGVTLESPSSSPPPGYWIADEPGFFKFALPATTPVAFSGTTCVPAGAVYFNAKIETVDSETRLVDGVATIKRDVPASFMGADYSGILAEYVVVGTFTAKRANLI